MFKVPLQLKDPFGIFSKSMEFRPGLVFYLVAYEQTVEKNYRQVAFGGIFFPDANE